MHDRVGELLDHLLVELGLAALRDELDLFARRVARSRTRRGMRENRIVDRQQANAHHRFLQLARLASDVGDAVAQARILPPRGCAVSDSIDCAITSSPTRLSSRSSLSTSTRIDERSRCRRSLDRRPRTPVASWSVTRRPNLPAAQHARSLGKRGFMREQAELSVAANRCGQRLAEASWRAGTCGIDPHAVIAQQRMQLVAHRILTVVRQQDQRQRRGCRRSSGLRRVRARRARRTAWRAAAR